jgi:transglutaminase-like putative cysteine protease
MTYQPHGVRRLFLAFLILSLTALSVRAGDDWRPVSPGDLAGKTPVVEKDADAEAIFWEVRVDDSSAEELALKHYVRVKIYTERGKEKYSKFELPFFKGMRIKDVAARVIKPDGSIVELKKEDIFERTVLKANGIKVKVKAFAVPGIEAGVIVEYRYREVIEDAEANMRLLFQRDIPIQTMSYYVRPFSGQRGMQYQTYNMPPEVKFVKDKDNYHRATMTNIPALREEPFMVPEDEVRAWVRIFYTSSDKPDPNAYWANLSPQVYEFFKDRLKPNDEVKKTAQEIVAGAATPEEKLSKIFQFCQTQIKNITFDYAMSEEERKKINNKSPGDTLKRRAGDAGDLDMLFGALAAAAGFEARVAWTADRSERFFTPRDANFGALHPACIAVKVGEGWKFYNPGSRYTAQGMLVWYEEGQAALIADKKVIWAQTPISAPQKSLAKRSGKFWLLEDGTLEGEARVEYTGHLAYSRRLAIDEDSAAQREARLGGQIKERLGSVEISDLAVENIVASDKPLVYAYQVRVPGYAQKTGKRLFIQPNFFEAGGKPAFTGSERRYDLYFNYGWAEDDNITVELPEGYELDSPDTPNPIKAGEICEDVVKMSVAKEGKKMTLIYQRKFSFGVTNDLLVFKVGQYNALKGLFESINRADTHSITLKQAAK